MKFLCSGNIKKMANVKVVKLITVSYNKNKISYINNSKNITFTYV